MKLKIIDADTARKIISKLSRCYSGRIKFWANFQDVSTSSTNLLAVAAEDLKSLN